MSVTAVFLPVTLWQKYVLEEATHPQCPDDLRDRFVLAHAFLVSNGIDMRRLRRAVAKLRQRHDTLRLRFDHVRGRWQAQMDAVDLDVIEEVALGDQGDGAFQTQISDLANAPMALVNAPLFKLLVVRCGKRGDVVILRAHHAVTDGHGMIVMLEDFSKLLFGLPILGKAVSHVDYLRGFQSPTGQRAAETNAFWRQMHHNMPSAPLIGRKAKGLEPLLYGFGAVVQRTLTLEASAESLRSLEAEATRAGNRPVTAMFAAYLEAMCQSYDQDRLMFMTSVSRADPKLDSYVGDHTLDPLMAYVPGGDVGFAKASEALGRTMMEGIAHLPSDMARRGGAYEAELVQQGAYPRQFVLEQPRALARQKRSMFSESFATKLGKQIRIGPFALTPLDVSVRRRKWGDMHFDVGGEGIRRGFRLHFDGISFEDAEVRGVAVKICGLLGLEPVQVTIS